jgi:hypothetical protein
MSNIFAVSSKKSDSNGGTTNIDPSIIIQPKKSDFNGGTINFSSNTNQPEKPTLKVIRPAFNFGSLTFGSSNFNIDKPISNLKRPADTILLSEKNKKQKTDDILYIITKFGELEYNLKSLKNNSEYFKNEIDIEIIDSKKILNLISSISIPWKSNKFVNFDLINIKTVFKIISQYFVPDLDDTDFNIEQIFVMLYLLKKFKVSKDKKYLVNKLKNKFVEKFEVELLDSDNFYSFINNYNKINKRIIKNNFELIDYDKLINFDIKNYYNKLLRKNNIKKDNQIKLLKDIIILKSIKKNSFRIKISQEDYICNWIKNNKNNID